MMSDHYSLNEFGYIPARPESSFCLGLDLGQTIDPTAACVVERIRTPIPPPEGIGSDLIQRLAEPRYELRWLERMPLRTSYVAIAAHVGSLLAKPPLRDNCQLVLDLTGVGRGVGDIFSHAGLDFIGVTITGGTDHETRDPDGINHHASKLTLVSRLQAALHSGELKIARNLPEAKVLAEELQNFRATISEATGYASFGARTGRHDDLVLALCLALWYLVGPRGMSVTQTPLLL